MNEETYFSISFLSDWTYSQTMDANEGLIQQNPNVLCQNLWKFLVNYNYYILNPWNLIHSFFLQICKVKWLDTLLIAAVYLKISQGGFPLAMKE